MCGGGGGGGAAARCTLQSEPRRFHMEPKGSFCLWSVMFWSEENIWSTAGSGSTGHRVDQVLVNFTFTAIPAPMFVVETDSVHGPVQT